MVRNDSMNVKSSTSRSWKQRWLRRFLVLGLLAGLLYLTGPLLLRSMARFLDVTEPAATTEYVMVLGGDCQCRPFVAAALVRAGRARKVLLPAPKNTRDAQLRILPPEQEIMKTVLLHEKVPPEAVVSLDGECSSTLDEARALAKFLENQPNCSVTVVTTSFHTRRARWIFRKVLGDKGGSVHFVGVPTDGFDETNWWHFELGCVAYLSETFKLGYYLLHY